VQQSEQEIDHKQRQEHDGDLNHWIHRLTPIA
jgi:hypothetical protein